MYFLIAHKSEMIAILDAETWFIISTLLAPIGFVLQDVVADALTVEAIPKTDEQGNEIDFKTLKSLNIVMQLLGRVSIISGTLLVSLVNLVMFSDSSEMSENEKIITYGQIYLYSLIVPGISVIGVLFSFINSKSRLNELIKNGLAFEKAHNLIYPTTKTVSYTHLTLPTKA